MATTTFYGLGGYDPEKPNNNIIRVEEIPDDETPDTSSDVMDVLLQAVKALAANKRAEATNILSALPTDTPT